MAKQNRIIEVAVISATIKCKQVVAHQRIQHSHISLFASELMKVGSFVPAIPAGEDKRGNTRYRLMTPNEIVERSIKISEQAFSAFDKMGWTADVPAFGGLIENDNPTGFLAKK